jgi:hypothetical protein
VDRLVREPRARDQGRGNPFSGVARTVTSDGSISDVSGTPLTGYTILTADSIDRATELAKGCPVLDDGQVHVYETFEVM